MEKFGYTAEEHDQLVKEQHDNFFTDHALDEVEGSSSDGASSTGDGRGADEAEAGESAAGPSFFAGSRTRSEHHDDLQRTATPAIVDNRYRKKQSTVLQSLEYPETSAKMRNTLSQSLTRFLKKAIGTDMREKIALNTSVKQKHDFERVDSADEDKGEEHLANIQFFHSPSAALFRRRMLAAAPGIQDRQNIPVGARLFARGPRYADEVGDLKRFHLLTPIVSVLEYLRWLATSRAASSPSAPGGTNRSSQSDSLAQPTRRSFSALRSGAQKVTLKRVADPDNGEKDHGAPEDNESEDRTTMSALQGVHRASQQDAQKRKKSLIDRALARSRERSDQLRKALARVRKDKDAFLRAQDHDEAFHGRELHDFDDEEIKARMLDRLEGVGGSNNASTAFGAAGRPAASKDIYLENMSVSAKDRAKISAFFKKLEELEKAREREKQVRASLRKSRADLSSVRLFVDEQLVKKDDLQGAPAIFAAAGDDDMEEHDDGKKDDQDDRDALERTTRVVAPSYAQDDELEPEFDVRPGSTEVVAGQENEKSCSGSPHNEDQDQEDPEFFLNLSDTELLKLKMAAAGDTMRKSDVLNADVEVLLGGKRSNKEDDDGVEVAGGMVNPDAKEAGPADDDEFVDPSALDANRQQDVVDRYEAQELVENAARAVAETEMEKDEEAVAQAFSSFKKKHAENENDGANATQLVSVVRRDGDRMVVLNDYRINVSGVEESWLMPPEEGFDLYQMETGYEVEENLVREQAFYFVGVRPPTGWSPKRSKEVFLYYAQDDGGGAPATTNSTDADVGDTSASVTKQRPVASVGTADHVVTDNVHDDLQHVVRPDGGGPAPLFYNDDRASGGGATPMTKPEAGATFTASSGSSPTSSEFEKWWRRMFAHLVEHNKETLKDAAFYRVAGSRYDEVIQKRIVVIFLMNLVKILLRRGELYYEQVERQTGTAHPEFLFNSSGKNHHGREDRNSAQNSVGKDIPSAASGRLATSKNATSPLVATTSAVPAPFSKAASSKASSSEVSDFSSLDDVYVRPPTVRYESFLKQVRKKMLERFEGVEDGSSSNSSTAEKDSLGHLPRNTHADTQSTSQAKTKIPLQVKAAMESVRELEKLRLPVEKWDLWEVLHAFENLYPKEAQALLVQLEGLGLEITNLLYMAGSEEVGKRRERSSDSDRPARTVVPGPASPHNSTVPSNRFHPSVPASRSSSLTAPLIKSQSGAMIGGVKSYSPTSTSSALNKNLADVFSPETRTLLQVSRNMMDALVNSGGAAGSAHDHAQDETFPATEEHQGTTAADRGIFGASRLEGSQLELLANKARDDHERAGGDAGQHSVGSGASDVFFAEDEEFEFRSGGAENNKATSNKPRKSTIATSLQTSARALVDRAVLAGEDEISKKSNLSKRTPSSPGTANGGNQNSCAAPREAAAESISGRGISEDFMPPRQRSDSSISSPVVESHDFSPDLLVELPLPVEDDDDESAEDVESDADVGDAESARDQQGGEVTRGPFDQQDVAANEFSSPIDSEKFQDVVKQIGKENARRASTGLSKGKGEDKSASRRTRKPSAVPPLVSLLDAVNLSKKGRFGKEPVSTASQAAKGSSAATTKGGQKKQGSIYDLDSDGTGFVVEAPIPPRDQKRRSSGRHVDMARRTSSSAAKGKNDVVKSKKRVTSGDAPAIAGITDDEDHDEDDFGLEEDVPPGGLQQQQSSLSAASSSLSAPGSSAPSHVAEAVDSLEPELILPKSMSLAETLRAKNRHNAALSERRKKAAQACFAKWQRKIPAITVTSYLQNKVRERKQVEQFFVAGAGELQERGSIQPEGDMTITAQQGNEDLDATGTARSSRASSNNYQQNMLNSKQDPPGSTKRNKSSRMSPRSSLVEEFLAQGEPPESSDESGGYTSEEDLWDNDYGDKNSNTAGAAFVVGKEPPDWHSVQHSR
ncbi:unnamed protein product [Amoebophrya sp. A120]|nr:unnamed protein product [Amoebophrya sp. A120]|eukprot:GSA120T00006308001.1